MVPVEGCEMMLFEQVKAALIQLLGAQAAGRYAVDGYRGQSRGAEAISGNLRHVTAYYRSGQFDKARSGWLQGPHRHAMTFAVELTLAAAARVDLSVLDDPEATPQARMSALAASLEAAANADSLWDELAGILWNILMDPRNAEPGGLAVAERWVGSLQKDNPAPKGEFVLLSGSMDYTCSGVERPAGEAGVEAASIDVSLETSPPGGTPADAAAGAQTDPSEV